MQRIDERSTVMTCVRSRTWFFTIAAEKRTLLVFRYQAMHDHHVTLLRSKVLTPGIVALGLALSLKQCPERLMATPLATAIIARGSENAAARTSGGRVLIRVKHFVTQILELPSLVHDFSDARDLPRH